MNRESGGSGTRLRLYLSGEHPCSYLPDRQAQTLFVDPNAAKDSALAGALANLGFRRSGGQLYRPECPGCRACIPARLPVRSFQPRRNQRRVWERNRHELTTQWRPARLTDEYFDLYERYLNLRHPDGEMANPSPEEFARFLISPWEGTLFLEVREGPELVAVAVTDHLPQGLSAVYTFFDPRIEARSPGVFCILNQIEEAGRLGLPWLYLGYWIPQCRKMNYKGRYRPLQLFIDGAWREFGPGQPIELPGWESPDDG